MIKKHDLETDMFALNLSPVVLLNELLKLLKWKFKMPDQTKYAKLKKCVDIASIIFVVYFFLLPIWEQYSPPPGRYPGEPEGILDQLMGIDLVPAVFGIVWLVCRLCFAPRGTYPFFDRFLNKDGEIKTFPLLIAGGGLFLLWLSLHKLATFLGRL
jgi:hypothetical protein